MDISLDKVNAILKDLKESKPVHLICEEQVVPYHIVKQVESEHQIEEVEESEVSEVISEAKELESFDDNDDEQLEKMFFTANKIIKKIRTMLEYNLEPKDLKSLAECLTALQNSLVNKQAPTIVNNQYNMSKTQVNKFSSLLKD